MKYDGSLENLCFFINFDKWGVKMGGFGGADYIFGFKMADLQFKMAEIGKKGLSIECNMTVVW